MITHDSAVIEMHRASPEFAKEDLAVAKVQARFEGGSAALELATHHLAKAGYLLEELNR